VIVYDYKIGTRFRRDVTPIDITVNNRADVAVSRIMEYVCFYRRVLGLVDSVVEVKVLINLPECCAVKPYDEITRAENNADNSWNWLFLNLVGSRALEVGMTVACSAGTTAFRIYPLKPLFWLRRWRARRINSSIGT
jgi:hypothetical protein